MASRPSQPAPIDGAYADDAGFELTDRCYLGVFYAERDEPRRLLGRVSGGSEASPTGTSKRSWSSPRARSRAVEIDGVADLVGLDPKPQQWSAGGVRREGACVLAGGDRNGLAVGLALELG